MIISFAGHKPSNRRQLTLPWEKVKRGDIVQIGEMLFYVSTIDNPIVTFQTNERRTYWKLKDQDGLYHVVIEFLPTYTVWRRDHHGH